MFKDVIGGPLRQWIARGLTLVFSLSAVGGWMAGAAEAEKVDGDFRGGRLDIRLVSEVNAIQPGQTFTVGVYLKHEKGWHTYWKHPGIVGVPTSLNWNLPEGFVAGDIQWPAPELTDMATLPVWGYERETCLLVDITPPEKLDLEADGKVHLRARASWMTCANTCHPGWQDFDLALDVAPAGASAWDEPWHALFEKSRSEFPEEVPAWDLSARFDKAKEEIVLVAKLPDTDGRSAGEFREVVFFSEDGVTESDDPQVFEANSGGAFTLTLKKSRYVEEMPDVLKGVLKSENGWTKDGDEGKVTAMRVSIPLAGTNG